MQSCGQPNAFSHNHVCAFCIRWRPQSRGKRRKVHARRYCETKCSCRLNKLHLLSLRASTNHRRPDFDRRSGQMVPDLAHSKGQRRRNAADVSWRRRKGEMERNGLAGDGDRESLESSFMWTRLERGTRTHAGRRANGTYGAPCLVDDGADAAAAKTGFDLALSTNPPLCGPDRAGVARSASVAK